MARIRSIHPNARKSKKLASCSAEAERLYWRLQTHCDDAGRCEDDPAEIASTLFPLRVARQVITLEHVEDWLDELAQERLIHRYVVNGDHYLQVTDFPKYQKPQRPTPSLIPPPDSASLPEEYASAPEPSTGVLHGEGVGEGDGGGGARKRATRPPKDFAPTDSHQAYATEHGLDLNRERQRWLDHCEAKGTTYKNINAGFTTWLHHAVDFGRGKAASPLKLVDATPYRGPDALARCPQCGRLEIDCRGHEPAVG